VAGERTTGRQAWQLLWDSSRRMSALVIAWMAASALVPALVVVALGAAVTYAASLILDPVGAALGTAARARITGRLQGRLLMAVSGPAGISHLEDAAVLDRLARAEGSLTWFFPEFVDEPTASLDAQAEHALFERYAQAARQAREVGAVTVLVSHRFAPRPWPT
jgi:ABC-type protease/lipase transport system fused ATPase/permease subunit